MSQDSELVCIRSACKLIRIFFFKTSLPTAAAVLLLWLRIHCQRPRPDRLRYTYTSSIEGSVTTALDYFSHIKEEQYSRSKPRINFVHAQQYDLLQRLEVITEEENQMRSHQKTVVS